MPKKTFKRSTSPIIRFERSERGESELKREERKIAVKAKTS